MLSSRRSATPSESKLAATAFVILSEAKDLMPSQR